MKALFDDVSNETSKIITKKYSTSFSLGIKLLDKNLHAPIYNIYGFVCLADEIVDSFHSFDKQVLLKKFREETVDAIRDGISLNPVLNSFQHTVSEYSIEWELIDKFLMSMEMDLDQKSHNDLSYDQYIFGSAEAVGLMCLRVFTNNDTQLFDKLKPYAQKLGAAFQKVNFLRDINADFAVLGRTYFPGVDFNSFSERDKQNIQNDIENDFREALIGIKLLPQSSRLGVYLAYYYYLKLFSKIKNTSHTKITHARIRIPNALKMVMMCKSIVRYNFNLL